MLISQISVFIENKPGRLSEITELIAKEDIDIRAFSLADTTDFGILRLIVNDPVKTEKVLKDAGLAVSITRVVAARVNDRPGALHGILKLLSSAGISVEYAYAFITRKRDDAYVILRIEDNEKAVRVLSEAGVSILPAEQVYSI